MVPWPAFVASGVIWGIIVLWIIYNRTHHAPAEHAIPRTGKGWLYFIGNGRGPIKVGVTRRSPSQRLDELQTGNPTHLKILWAVVVDDPQNAEGEAHNHLAHAHVGGEWYERKAALELIEILRGKIPEEDASASSLLD